MARRGVEAYYDSDEGIAWGPYTAKEMKDDLQRPRPKPKQRRTVCKIKCKDPSTSSSNDTMFSAASELEKENSSRICNVDNTNLKTEGSSMVEYYTADETYHADPAADCDDSVITISSGDSEEEEGEFEKENSSRNCNVDNINLKTEGHSMTEHYTAGETYHAAPKGDCHDSVIAISSEEEEALEFEKENSSRNCNVDNINLKTEGHSMTEHHTAGETYHASPRGDCDDSVIAISNEEEEDGYEEHVFNTYGNMLTPIQINKENKRSHSLRNSSHDDKTYTARNSGCRYSDYDDIPVSEISQSEPDQPVNAEPRLNISSKGSGTSMSDSVRLDISTDTSSVFDASCFNGDEPWNPELDTTTDEDEAPEAKQNLPSSLPVKSTKLTPARCLTQKGKVTPYETSPQVFKVPEVVTSKKLKAPDKFKDVVSPVRLYIQHSPMPHLKQTVLPHPVKSPLMSTKASPSINKKTDTLDNCEMLRPVLYKPPGKSIVTTQSKQLFMPPSLGKYVKDPLVVKHEKKLNVKEVSRLTEKLGLDESSFGSEADMSSNDSVNMSVLCIKKNFK